MGRGFLNRKNAGSLGGITGVKQRGGRMRGTFFRLRLSFSLVT